ncbi:radical SAM protein [Thermodesulfobacteriota bacterium]
MGAFEPAYIKNAHTGVLESRAKQAHQLMEVCELCPRRCGVDRTAGELGVCRTAENAWVSSFSPHFGEESPLVGTHGSGTIFFTHCNLLCNFCQNFDISHEGQGEPVSDVMLAGMMLQLQDMGCHNINFVTPSHVVPQILGAISIAASKGLAVPLVYNSGGYDRVDTLNLLEGIFDIYMPDFKFWGEDIAQTTCDAPDYPEVARQALKEMHRQVGDLVIDDSGLAERGVLIRHLVLPDGLAGTRQVMRFIANNLSDNSYVNIMPQYRPCGRAHAVPGLRLSLSQADYRDALQAAREEGITRLDQRRRVFRLW